ncbi:hypothetical protein KA977_09410 [Candidatus Dependentiae bacterium]|nr:hypothetical protein [Candidatus Dependentiae bacterium]
MKKISSILFIFMLVVFVNSVLCFEDTNAVKDNDERPVISNYLDLTAEQKKQIIELQSELRKTINPLSKQLMKQKDELLEIWKNHEPLEEKMIIKKADEVTDIGLKVRNKSIEFRIAVKKILTKEQWQKIIKLKEKVHANLKNRMNNWNNNPELKLELDLVGAIYDDM